VASLLLWSLLLSACGRVVDDTTPNTTAPSSVPTPPALEATAELAVSPLTLDGTIEQLSQERWVVAGTPVVLDAQTTITGAPALGALAHIQGKLTTDGAVVAHMITIAASVATSAAAPPLIIPATPFPVPTATPLPPGSVVNITGVIENITITNNVTTVVVQSVTYVLPHNFVVLLGKRLRIGVPIMFVGQMDTAGQIIISNVVQINNQVVIINRPRHQDENDDHQGDEGDD